MWSCKGTEGGMVEEAEGCNEDQIHHASRWQVAGEGGGGAGSVCRSYTIPVHTYERMVGTHTYVQ